MMPRQARIFVVLLLILAVLETGFAKGRLAQLQPDRKRFLEAMYVPTGAALRVLACGFDAPLADLLWVQGLIYYSENVRASQEKRDKNAQYRYVYKIHDIITDLNPRFVRAYIYGGLFLLSTGKEEQVLRGIHLFHKGLQAYRRAAEQGQGFTPDERWRLHVYIASAYETHLRSLHIEAGDRLRAHADRRQALAHFKRAAAMGNAPLTVAMAYEGLAQQTAGVTHVEARYDTRIKVWQDLLEEKQSNKEFQAYAAKEVLELMRKRDRMLQTRKLEAGLSHLCRGILKQTGRLPEALQALVAAGRLRFVPPSPMDAPGAETLPAWHGRDRWLILPAGEVRSAKLASLEASFMLDALYDAVFDYYHKHEKTFPPTLEALVADGILDQVPAHPLRALGYRFLYDPKNGDLRVGMPNATPQTPSPAPPAQPSTEQGAPTSAVPAGHVRVAAIQFCSVFGEPDVNRRRLVPFIETAARQGAKIVVLPEACIPGYADMTQERFWSKAQSDRNHRPVHIAAERADGESRRFFAPLVKRLRIYLTVPIIERAGPRYHITVLLLDPSGKTVLRHRKQILWTVADGGWATPGRDDDVPVVDTPYGRLGVMICRDMHALPECLAAKKVDIVLHSAGFYGPNFEGYLQAPKFLHKIRTGHFALVLANWSVPEKPWWQGYGLSRVVAPDGHLMARAKNDLGDAVVLADLPIRRREGTP